MLKNVFLFLVGALSYGFVELAWRGHTHWTMLLLGGVCFVLLYYLSESKLPFLLQCLAGTIGITLLELITGLLCNQMFHLDVWDYSHEWGNLYGQICPRYSLFWFLLCLPIFAIFRICKKKNAS